MKKYILLIGLICCTLISIKANTFKTLSDSLITQKKYQLDTTIVPLVELGARGANGLTNPINLTGLTNVGLTELNLKAGELIAALPQQYQSSVKIFYFAMYPGVNDLIKDTDGHSLLFKEYEEKVKVLSTYYILMGTMTDGDKLEFDIEVNLPAINFNQYNLFEDDESRSMGERVNNNFSQEFETTYLDYMAGENGGEFGKEAKGIEAILKKYIGQPIGPYFLNMAGYLLKLDASKVSEFYYLDSNKDAISGWLTTDNKRYKSKFEGNKFKGYELNGVIEVTGYTNFNSNDQIVVHIPFSEKCTWGWSVAEYIIGNEPAPNLYTNSNVVIKEKVSPPSKQKVFNYTKLECQKKNTTTNALANSVDPVIYDLPEEYIEKVKNLLVDEFEAVKSSGKNTLTEENFKLNARLYITLTAKDENKGLWDDKAKAINKFQSIKIEENDIVFWYAYDSKTNKIAAIGYRTKSEVKLYYEDKTSHYFDCAKIPFKVIYELADGFSKLVSNIKIPEKIWDCGLGNSYYFKFFDEFMKVDIKEKIKKYIPIPLGKNDLIDLNNYVANEIEESFAFYCGLWNGLVEVVKGVPELFKLGASLEQKYFDCINDPSECYNGAKNAGISILNKINEPIYKEGTSPPEILYSLNQSGPKDFYYNKLVALKNGMYNAIVAQYGGNNNRCKREELKGSIVGPIVVLIFGDVAAVESISGTGASIMKKFLSFLKWCDNITDAYDPLSNTMKIFASTASGIVSKISAKIINSSGQVVAEVSDDGQYLIHHLYDDVGKQVLVGPVPVDENTMKKAIEGTESITIGNYKGKIYRKVFNGKVSKNFISPFIDFSSNNLNKIFQLNQDGTKLFYRLKKGNETIPVEIGAKDANGDFDLLDNIDDATTPNTDIEIVDALDDEMGVARKKGGDECELRNPGGCFIAGTKVHTRTGIKKIEDIKENEEVLAFDETQKNITFARVALAFRLTAQYLTKVIIGKDTLTTTPNHPFFVPAEVSEADGTHWLQAGSLRKGMLVLLASGVLSSVDTIYTYAANTPVYNFEIAEQHNYYVGESGVLVHNGNCIVNALNNFLDNHDIIKNWKGTAQELQAFRSAFIADFGGGMDFINASKYAEISLEAYKVFYDAGRNGLRKNIDFLKNMTKCLENQKLKDLGMDESFLKNLAKNLGEDYGAKVSKPTGELLESQIWQTLNNFGNFIKNNPNTRLTNFQIVLSHFNLNSAATGFPFNKRKGMWGTLKQISDNPTHFADKNLHFENSANNFRITSSSIDVEIIDVSKPSFIDGRYNEFKAGPGSIDKDKIITEFIERDLFNATSPLEIRWWLIECTYSKKQLSDVLKENITKLNQVLTLQKRQQWFGAKPENNLDIVEGDINHFVNLYHDKIFKQ